MKTKLIENIDIFLNKPKGFKKSWVRTLITLFVAFAIAITTLMLILNFGPQASNSLNSNTDLYKNLNQANVLSFVNASNILTYIVFGMIAFPFIVLATFWIIGINQTSRSKFFHLFMWIIAFLALLLALIALILFIRAAITNNNNYF